MLLSLSKYKPVFRFAALVPFAVLIGCASSDSAQQQMDAPNMQPAKLFANLPNNCPTPDAFAIAPDGSLTLSCPNFANGKLQGELLSIDGKGNVSHLTSVPTLTFKRKANPMGIAYDDEGALYVADSRGPKFGRILKLTFDNRTLVKTEVIASGFNPNGVRIHDGYVYASQLMMPKVKSKHNVSSIYRFALTDRNVKVTNTLADQALVFHTETINPDVKFGLDGLAFDSKGQFYTADLGDGEVYKLEIDKHGKAVKRELFASVPNDVRIDGMVFDEHDNMYLAGFGLNQIYKVTPSGNVSKIADYPDNDGSDGQIDQPADLMVYQNKLIISNFDLMKGKGIRNSGHGKPYTVSYIDLN